MPMVTKTGMRRDFWGLNDTFTNLRFKTKLFHSNPNATEQLSFLLFVRRRLPKTTNNPQLVSSPPCRYNVHDCAPRINWKAG